MKILITGAAGNLGVFLSRRLFDSHHSLNLMIHHKALSFKTSDVPQINVYKADLENPETLYLPCEGVDCIVHFAGVLFAPKPEKFLHHTNVIYVKNLINVAHSSGVRKFILISFPHVEGESTSDNPARGHIGGHPKSVHAQTRLQAELYLFSACEGSNMLPVLLRPGMIYAKGVLMIDAARWLLKHHLLGVWRGPTWIHLISLPDFLHCVVNTIEGENISGVYNLGDDQPLTLQEFLDTIASHWGYRKPWRGPDWIFPIAGSASELVATIIQTPSPLTRDFIKIGMASYVSDTTRMKADLLPALKYPTFQEGLNLL
jgi:nucleoside-diphosphate-sugar epimerase